MRFAALLALLLLVPGATAAELRAPLPPEPDWSGPSEALVAAPDDPWITPAERSGLTRTPGYEETMAYVDRLVAAAPELARVDLGRSPEGREIVMVVASRDGATTPAELAANGRPTLLAQGGIHSGEIDGKDAGLMLLRDMTVGGTRRELLERANFLLVPILNVDGHERSSAWSRMNQRGPVEQGWRTTSRNLNLNRDYAKLDTPELRALVDALGAWQPDLYYDIHVTDGADYQYDVTLGWNGEHAWSPAIARWLDEALWPAVSADLAERGHVPGPLIFTVDRLDPSRGIYDWTSPPRFSHGYGAARHLPTVLVENHSLKSHRRRVLGTYVLLTSTLELLGREGEALRDAIAADRARRDERVALDFRAPEGDERPTTEFAGIGWQTELSPISGMPVIRWTGEPVDLTVPVHANTEPAERVERPVAYWIPPGWDDVIERLVAHGIEVERIEQPRTLEVEMYRLEDAKLADQPYEGRVRVSAQPRVERRTETYPARSVRVPTDQPLGTLAMLLLEPASGDSFLQWGFFLEVLSRTEYAEPYVLEPLAREMLAADPELAAEFERRLREDAEFRGSPRARLEFFYRRTPYWDERFLLYPVGRELR